MITNRLFKILLAGVTVFFVGILPVQAAERLIRIKGSDTMVNLGQAWAEEFMVEHPRVNISVMGDGSATGIASLISGTCDIAQSSREIKPEEKERALKNGYEIHEFKVAIDAVAIVVHPSNSVKKLNFEQLLGIYTGRITHWGGVGGPDRKILALSRDRNSGTHVYFVEHILTRSFERRPEQFGSAVVMLSSSQAIVEEVAGNESAIGYTGLGYVSPELKMVPIARKSRDPFVKPSKASIRGGAYPLVRPLFFYTGKKPEGVERMFIDFVLSEQGQKIVKDMDFVPLEETV